MKTRDISCVSSSFVGRFTDEVGALRKRNQLKRLEPYANIINEVFEKYNTDDDKRTMMFKLLRSPIEGTVTRRKHTENCKEIAGEIADSFDWLNSDITRVMARHHDIGHTFLGHSGEWWLSSIKDTYGMPNFVHNAIGARNLYIRYHVQDEIIEKIKAENPNISVNKLNAIKNDLWLMYDAINDHNGEKSEYSYVPDFSKNKKQYEEELVNCYVKKGYDRTLIPSTAEGSLMRLTDKISYIPFDLVDIFRNGCNKPKMLVNGEEYNFYDEYRKAFKELGMPDDSLDKLLACKTCEEYDEFAKSIQKIFIEDVKKNTKRNNIRMSEKVSNQMHKLRDINNKLMVNYTVMKEDHEQYVPVLEEIMKSTGDGLIRTGIIDKHNIEESNITRFVEDKELREELLKSFESHELSLGFAKFISKITKEDFAFTVDTCKKAFEETISSEIQIARDVATGSLDAVEIRAQGNKKARIEEYINQFKVIIDTTSTDPKMRKILNPMSNSKIDMLKRKIWFDKATQKIKEDSIQKLKEGGKGIIPLYKMVAMEIGAQYLASLNDYEWRDLFQKYSQPSKEVIESLGRQYHTFDFVSESQTHKNWDNIRTLQDKDNFIGWSINERPSLITAFKKIITKNKNKDNGER